MGADMIVQHIVMKLTDEKNRKKQEQRMLQALSKIKNKMAFNELYCECRGEDEVPELSKIKPEIRKAINEFWKALHYRDVTYIEHKGDKIYLTGGMSWGDTPDGSYRTFETINNLPPEILRAGGLR